MTFNLRAIDPQCLRDPLCLCGKKYFDAIALGIRPTRFRNPGRPPL